MTTPSRPRFSRLPAYVAALAVAAALLAPRPASASPACDCDARPEDVAYDAAPTNVRFLLSAAAAQPLPALVAKSDPSKPAATVHAAPAGDDAGHVWIVPDADLAPNADYTLKLASGGSIDVHTSAARATAAPALAGVSTGPEGGFAGACPAQIATTLAPTGDGASSAAWLRIAVDGAGGHHVVLVSAREPSVGRLVDGSCGNAPWASEGTVAVHVSAIDLAGNESAAVGPSNVEMMRVRGRGGCFCDAALGSAAGGGAAVVALVALVLACGARRRPRAAANARR
jgi:hypothetical protein